MTRIYLSLGSNIGHRQNFINTALRKLSNHINIHRKSSLYETAPWGKTDQPKFLNLCLMAETDLPSVELLDFVKNVEQKSGRNAGEKWGPREIDIDILFYGNREIEEDGLIIPHPHLHERAFVLVPLREIAPDLIHPTFDKSIAELANKIDKSGVVLYET